VAILELAFSKIPDFFVSTQTLQLEAKSALRAEEY
jgi:hypothetical protein